MCGLAIAIIALIPFNFFLAQAGAIAIRVESAATNVEVMVTTAKQKDLIPWSFDARGRRPS